MFCFGGDRDNFLARRTINARQGKEEVKSIWNVLVSSNLVSSVQLVKSSSAKLTGNCFV